LHSDCHPTHIHDYCPYVVGKLHDTNLLLDGERDGLLSDRINYSAIGRTTSATGDASIYLAEKNLQGVNQID
jgi:hypothetical protein